jgi:hypothetical protein
MSFQDDAIRALIRGAGYRINRSAPLWVSIAIIAAAIIFGSHR